MAAKDTVPLSQARKQLSTIWFVGSGLIFLVIVAQSIGTVYQGQLSELWGWFLPTLLPTLSLIVSVLGATAIDTQAPATSKKVVLVRSDFHSITFWLTWMYLGLLLATILAQPAARFSFADENAKAIDVLKVSSLWLTPVQILVVAAMGVLFFTRR